MEAELELIADYHCITGEEPRWHPDEQAVYWLDIPAGRMFRYEPATGRHEIVYQGESIGGFTIQSDGALLLFMARGAVKVWRAGQLTTVIDELPEERTTRFNDVAADPEGRVFCGTMSTPERLGRLYRLDRDGTITKIVEGVGTSNGIGFTPDLRHMYHTDTRQHAIYLYDYDRTSGAIANRRVFVRTPDDPGEGRPDGLTVDADGCVWSARWDGSCLVRYRPDGTEDRRIHFPAKKVSCPIFGGPSYTDLYVTTAGGDHQDVEGPGAGCLFRLRPGVRGVPPFRSRIGL